MHCSTASALPPSLLPPTHPHLTDPPSPPCMQEFGKKFDELDPHDRQRVGGKVRVVHSQHNINSHQRQLHP